MRFLTCSVDTTPCPLESQQWLPMAEAFDFASFGITPELFTKVYAFGFGAVFSAFCIGWVLGIAVLLIRKA